MVLICFYNLLPFSPPALGNHCDLPLKKIYFEIITESQEGHVGGSHGEDAITS